MALTDDKGNPVSLSDATVSSIDAARREEMRNNPLTSGQASAQDATGAAAQAAVDKAAALATSAASGVGDILWKLFLAYLASQVIEGVLVKGVKSRA